LGRAVRLMALLTESEVDRWVDDHDAWQREGDAIIRTIECASFPAAIELVGAVAEVAEQQDHHPDIDIRWRTVRFSLSTHSAGGITANDTELAARIDALAGRSAR
jgi:4a-hydroxytetrahydrobiopterin dehydratase